MAKTYDPTLYSLVIAGIPIPAKGYADGEFIRWERDSDSFTDVAGTDGEVTRAKQYDKRATITFTLMQSSEMNAVLSTLANLDESTDGGAGIGPFLLKDRGGLTVLAGKDCWIAKMPDGSLDKNPTARAWKVRVANLKSFEGGN